MSFWIVVKTTAEKKKFITVSTVTIYMTLSERRHGKQNICMKLIIQLITYTDTKNGAIQQMLEMYYL